MSHYSEGILLLGLICAASTACRETERATERVANTVTCAQVCNRYSTCFDEKSNLVECTKRCEGVATSSQDRENRLEACHHCMADKACATGAFHCKAQCAGVVP